MTLLARCLVGLALVGCGGSHGAGGRHADAGPDGPVDPRAIVPALTAADEPLATRPELLAGKLHRMAEGPFEFYRGSLALYARDFADPAQPIGQSRFPPRTVPAIGDPHPENFGTLRASDGSVALEPNDFDVAARRPYLFDVRRLVVGMVLAARTSNAGHGDDRRDAAAAAPDIAAATARGYAQAMVQHAGGAPRARVTTPGASVVLADLFSRAAERGARRAELEDLTVVRTVRSLQRGEEDDESDHVLCDAPAEAWQALEPALAAYANSLPSAVAPDTLRVLDLVREHGVGIGSWPRVRFLLLVRGATADPADDLILEIKELVEGVGALSAARLAWGRPDAEPLWGEARYLGFPVQIRAETAAHRTIRVKSLTGDLGKPAALVELGRQLGALLARMHAADREATAAIARDLGTDLEGFVAEQAATGLAYADVTEADHDTFKAARKRLGDSLGLPPQQEADPLRRLLFAGPCPH